MKPFSYSAVIVLFAWSCLASLSHAGNEPAAEVQRELRIEFSTFGRGMAEAIRGMGKRAEPKETTEHVIHSEQAGANYRIKWITKKSAPDASFPEYMRLDKVGTILPGDTILGKTSQAEIINRMGRPDQKDRERLIYQLPGYQGDDVAIFTFRKDKLSVVEWQWFVD